MLTADRNVEIGPDGYVKVKKRTVVEVKPMKREENIPRDNLNDIDHDYEPKKREENKPPDNINDIDEDYEQASNKVEPIEKPKIYERSISHSSLGKPKPPSRPDGDLKPSLSNPIPCSKRIDNRADKPIPLPRPVKHLKENNHVMITNDLKPPKPKPRPMPREDSYKDGYTKFY